MQSENDKNKPYYSMTESPETQTPYSIEAAIEAVLFVAAGPVSINQLAETLAARQADVEIALKHLEEAFASENRGIRMQFHEGRVQLTTSPYLAGIVENFLGLEATARLSRAALETLAIIAYRQPVTRPGVDSIRGVNSDGVMKSLLQKGLLQEMGRADGPGRPILYGTTPEFLQHFGLSSIRELPAFEVDEEEQSIENGLLKD